jgi:ATP-dependent DNA ligase
VQAEAGTQYLPDPHRGPREVGGCVVVASSPAPVVVRQAAASASALGWTKPMLASAMKPGTTIAAYEDDAFVLQEKKDGDRVLVRKQGDAAQAWSRPKAGKEPLARMLPPDILAAVLELPDGLYDGELMLPGTTCRTDAPRGYFLFDLLELLGENLHGKPFSERHDLLTLAVAHHTVARTAQDGSVEGPILLIVPPLEPVSMDAIERLWAAGKEGAVLKRLESTYQPGHRTADWIKVKKSAVDVLTIVGFKAGKLGPYAVAELRSDDGRETRVTTKDGATMRDVAKDPSRYIGRRLVIAYTEKTESGSWRHAGWDHVLGVGE